MIASTFPASEDDSTRRFVYDVTKEISKLGHNVKVLAPYRSNSKIRYSMRGVQVERFHYFYPKRFQILCEDSGIPANINKGLFAKSQLLTYILASMRKQLGKNIFDLIHVHWPIPNAFAALFAKKLYNIPFINTIYGAEVYLSKKYHVSFLLNYLINESEKSIVISHGTYRACLSCRFDENKLKIIPIGVDINLFKPINAKKDGSIFQIISVGRLVERKGFEYLIKATSEVVKEYKDVKVKIAGSGPRKQILQDLIKKYKLNKIISLIGPKSHKELVKLYNESDLFVLPSIIDSKGDTEGLGVVFLEAMACKLPVIGTNVGGIPEIVKHNHSGIIVPEKESSELAKAILEMINDKKKRERLAKSGYEIVRNEYNWNIIAREIVRVYDEALNKV